MSSLITSDPAVMMGKPVIAGTRITVESILARLGEGQSIQQVIADHSRLTEEGVRAAMKFRADTLSGEVVYPLASGQ